MSCNFVVVLVFELCWSFWWAFTRAVFLSFRFSFFPFDVDEVVVFGIPQLGCLRIFLSPLSTLHSSLLSFMII